MEATEAMLEVEQKFRLEDFAQIRQKLTQLGAKLHSQVSERDLYLNAPDRDFAKTGEAFRIRCTDNQCFLTYKGPRLQSEVKVRKEIEVCLGAKEIFHSHLQLWEALGYKQVAWVEKTREVHHLELAGDSITISLDEVVGLGKFAEVEILVDEGKSENAAQRVLQAAKALGLTTHEPKSYLRMVLEKR